MSGKASPDRRPSLLDRLRHPFRGLRYLHGNFCVREEPWADPELLALVGELSRLGASRGIVAWPRIPLEGVVRSASWGLARHRDARILKGLVADAGLFRRADGRVLALLELTTPGFFRGKARREARLRKVLEGAGLPLVRWNRGEAPVQARLEAILGTLGREEISAVAPLCPLCGGAMARRLARRGTPEERAFWGCTRYPDCRGTRSADK